MGKHTFTCDTHHCVPTTHSSNNLYYATVGKRVKPSNKQIGREQHYKRERELTVRNTQQHKKQQALNDAHVVGT